jgi:hypothetical protein
VGPRYGYLKRLQPYWTANRPKIARITRLGGRCEREAWHEGLPCVDAWVTYRNNDGWLEPCVIAV